MTADGPAGRPIYALSDGMVVRYLQWEGDRIVRAGIPRRVDGEVYVGVVVTAASYPRTEAFWGLDGVELTGGQPGSIRKASTCRGRTAPK